ncbi:MAG: DUF2267 domain-containing protein [Chloroflexi bacterium]|nr:DUF2267 domain-containing protein [Chloroflexota bacterium]
MATVTTTSTVPGLFDTTIQKTNIWLKNIMDEMGWKDRHRAYLALRGVLHSLRDRLTVEEAVDLGAELPLLIRGVYYEGWRPAGKPEKFSKCEFLENVAGYFTNEPDVDAEKIVKAVFRVMSRMVEAGEIKDIKGSLPKEFASLWET